MNKNEFDREREDQRHHFTAGMIWVSLLAVALVALLAWIWQHPRPGNPERFLESTVPID